MNFNQFGGKISPDDLTHLQQSAHWRNGTFQNLEATTVLPGFLKLPQIIFKQIRGQKQAMPSRPLAVAPFDKDRFLQAADKARFAWYGHSALLLRLHGKTLLIDPMLGPDASPISPVKTRRFSENTLDLIDELPEIDLMLLTHDHYDHLDYASIQKLLSKTRNYFVALGVKRHLTAWGVDPDQIAEFDWWDHRTFDDIEIHFTPTRHFSGRGLMDRAKSLWGGWAFHTDNERIWFSGDGGYGTHFKAIGTRLGPFDIAFMECGQYCADWPQVHLFPEEAVQAALDAGARKAMPVHWGGFSLSYWHSWFEPVEAFAASAAEKGLDYLTPPIGALFDSSTADADEWWSDYK